MAAHSIPTGWPCLGFACLFSAACGPRLNALPQGIVMESVENRAETILHSPTPLRDDPQRMRLFSAASSATYQQNGPAEIARTYHFASTLRHDSSGGGFRWDLYRTRTPSEGRPSVVVAFRGTETAHGHLVSNILADARAELAPEAMNNLDVAVHRGFSEALGTVWTSRTPEKSLREILKAAAVRSPRQPRVWFTGHSLGGAMATLAAYRAQRAFPDLDVAGVVTYGAPRVGDLRFAQSYDALGLGTKTVRFVLGIDPVPHLPPSGPGWTSLTGALGAILSPQGFNVLSAIYQAGRAYVHVGFTHWLIPQNGEFRIARYGNVVAQRWEQAFLGFARATPTSSLAHNLTSLQGTLSQHLGYERAADQLMREGFAANQADERLMEEYASAPSLIVTESRKVYKEIMGAADGIDQPRAGFFQRAGHVPD